MLVDCILDTARDYDSHTSSLAHHLHRRGTPEAHPPGRKEITCERNRGTWSPALFLKVDPLDNPSTSSMSTFDTLIADLTRDVHRVQPKDVLQFCANWFQSRLEEQRTRTRDALAHRPSLAVNIPLDLYVDTPIAPQPVRSATSPFTDPFEPRRISASQSAFGISGNGLFSSDGMPDPTTTTMTTATTTSFPAPSFRFDSEPTPVDPYSVLDHITPSQSPAPGDYLHPPGFNLMQRRTSVSAEPISVDSENHQPLPVYPKTEDQLRRIKA